MLRNTDVDVFVRCYVSCYACYVRSVDSTIGKIRHHVWFYVFVAVHGL